MVHAEQPKSDKMILANETLGYGTIPVYNIFSHVCRSIPAEICARNHPFLITRHLYVNLAGDQFL